MRRIFSGRRIAAAVSLTALTVMAAGIMLGASRRPTCRVPAELPRVLRLETAPDRTHLEEDVRRIVQTATAYREYVAQQPLESGSRDAVTNHARRPARAYEYCKAVQEDAVARAHGIDRATVKARVEAIAEVPGSVRRD